MLIPAFALGRAQELCMLLDDYWERMNLKVPIYFSAGLTIQANMYYKVLINWASQKVKSLSATRNAFDFKNVHSFERSMINAPGPCVLFATPGMISGGFSLEVFKQWAPCEQNLITLPGYCVAGTVGHKLSRVKLPTKINVDESTQIDVRCQIQQLSFSAHTDSRGIMDLVRFLSPKNVILVHGEKPKMVSLSEKIKSELGIPCYYPANNESLRIESTQYIKAEASKSFLESSLCPNFKFLKAISRADTDFILNERAKSCVQVCDDRIAEGALIMQKDQHPKIVHQNELMDILGAEKHKVQVAYCCPVCVSDELKDVALSSGEDMHRVLDKRSLLHFLYTKLSNYTQDITIQNDSDCLQIESFTVSPCLKEKCPHRIHVNPDSTYEAVNFCCAWSMEDEKLAWRIISIMKNLMRSV